MSQNLSISETKISPERIAVLLVSIQLQITAARTAGHPVYALIAWYKHNFKVGALDSLMGSRS